MDTDKTVLAVANLNLPFPNMSIGQLKVLHIANDVAPRSGGVHTSIVQFMVAAKSVGMDTHCVSIDSIPEISPYAAHEEWSVINPIDTGNQTYRYLPKRHRQWLFQTVEQYDIVVTHLMYRHHAVLAAQAAQAAGKPLVIVPHGSLDPWVFTYRGFRKRTWLFWYRKLLFGPRTSLLFATSRECEKAVAAVPDLVSCHKQAIHWPLSRPAPGRMPTLSLTKRMLLVGRIHPMKRVLETIDAFIRSAENSWELRICGPITDEISLDTLSKRIGGSNRILYLGSLTPAELDVEYSAADALVLLSHRENFGHVVAEAMHSGVPVLISDSVDLCPVVEQYKAGVTLSISCDADLDRGIATFTRLPKATLLEMARNAKDAARIEFSLERFSLEYTEFLWKCVNR
jgi:glycosyltransferase involved in cell wall biosynthesis